VRDQMNRPTVLLVGEIYVRCDPFSNGFVVEKLESLGLRVRLAPVNEWIEYADQFWDRRNLRPPYTVRFRSAILSRIQHLAHGAIAAKLDWPPHTPVRDVLAAAKPYMRQDLEGEAVLTIGSPVHEWQSGHIAAVLSVGPLECMPNKIAEAQFFHVAEQEGLLTLTLALNGEPVDPEVLDNFAFEVRARQGRKHGHPRGHDPARSLAKLKTTRSKSA
jgi:predicted nucleotide-binding protein (sugar kinase/HSP70/actin superfamily)